MPKKHKKMLKIGINTLTNKTIKYTNRLDILFKINTFLNY